MSKIYKQFCVRFKKEIYALKKTCKCGFSQNEVLIFATRILGLFPDPHGCTNAGTTAHLYTSAHTKKLVSMHAHSDRLFGRILSFKLFHFFQQMKLKK